MQQKLSFKQAAFIVGLMIIVLLLVLKNQGGTSQSVVSAVSEEQLVSGLPVRLKIPKIGVDALIQSVGLTPDGAMDAPKEPANTAWFNQGPRPGEKRSAVIDGHFGWKNNIPAVFDNLSKLKKGDKILVENDGGTTITFVVRETKTFGENADTSNIFSSSDGLSHLNLITCEGIYNKVTKSYSGRLVVFADKE